MKSAGRFSRYAPIASPGAVPCSARICWRSSYSTAVCCDGNLERRPHALLGEPDAPWRPGSDLLGSLHRSLQQPFVIYDVRDQPDARGFVGVEAPAGQHQLVGAGGADQARQQPARRHVAVRQADVDEGRAEDRAACRVADVARTRERDPEPRRPAVHCGDHRLRRRAHLQDQPRHVLLVAEVVPRQVAAVVPRRLPVAAQVDAGTEAAPGPGHDHRPAGAVGRDRPQLFVQRGAQVGVDRVQLLGPVERHEPHMRGRALAQDDVAHRIVLSLASGRGDPTPRPQRSRPCSKCVWKLEARPRMPIAQGWIPRRTDPGDGSCERPCSGSRRSRPSPWPSRSSCSTTARPPGVRGACKPPPFTAGWSYQLQGTPRMIRSARVYDVDGFDTPKSYVVAAAQSSAGTRSVTSARARGRTGVPTGSASPAPCSAAATAGPASGGSTSAGSTSLTPIMSDRIATCAAQGIRRGGAGQRRRLHERDGLSADRPRTSCATTGELALLAHTRAAWRWD